MLKCVIYFYLRHITQSWNTGGGGDVPNYDIPFFL